MKFEYEEDDFEEMLPFLEMMNEELSCENYGDNYDELDSENENDSIADYWSEYHKDDGDFNEEYDEMSDSEEKAYNIYNEEILNEYEDEYNQVHNEDDYDDNNF